MTCPADEASPGSGGSAAEGAAGEDAWLQAAFTHFDAGEDVVLGLGHDTAAVRVGPAGVVVVTKDVLVDGVHFHASRERPEDLAMKALGVNLSDLAAAAAVPVGFLVGAVLPRPVSRPLFEGLMRGFAAAARTWACPCLGGDTNTADGPLVLSVTALGRPGPMGVLGRSGARVGDILSVTGPLGGSLAGRHLHPRPRIAAALALAEAGIPHAMMDVSDGLGRDLPRLCRASGVGARIDAARIPIHRDACGTEARSPREQALFDGEDFELLLAHDELSEEARRRLAAVGVQLHPIGHIVPEAEGLRLLEDGTARPWRTLGFDHFDAP